MIQLAHCQIEHIPGGCTTRFPDGSHWEAFPHDTPHYDEIAERCGYGLGLGWGDAQRRAEGRLRYCREHEVIHALLAEELLGGPSPIMWALAHGEAVEPGPAAYEEAAVMTTQRWIRGGERPIIGGVDWDALRARALEISHV